MRGKSLTNLLILVLAVYFGFLYLSYHTEEWRRRVENVNWRRMHIDSLIGRLSAAKPDNDHPQAPTIFGLLSNGEDFVLDAYQGGPVLLSILRLQRDGSLDPASQQQVVELSTIQEQLGPLGLNVVVATAGDLQRATKLAQMMPSGVQVIHSLDQKIVKDVLELQQDQLPSSILVDKRGRMLRGAPETKPTNPAGHDHAGHSEHEEHEEDDPWAVPEGPDRGPIPYRPTVQTVLSLLRPTYPEFKDLDQLRRMTELLMGQTLSLELATVSGIARGLFRCISPDGRPVGWLRSLHGEVLCPVCEDPRYIITVEESGRLRALRFLHPVESKGEILDPVGFVTQFSRLKRGEEAGMPLSPRAREDMHSNGWIIVDKLVGATRTSNVVMSGVEDTFLLLDVLDPRMGTALREPIAPNATEITAP